MAQRFDGSGKVIGTSGESDSGSSGSSGGGAKILQAGVEAEIPAAVNAIADGGLLNSINPIRGLPQAFQAFALEATAKGGSLQNLTSSLSLPSPVKIKGNSR